MNRFLLIYLKWNLYKDTVPVIDRYIETLRSFGVQNDGEGPEIFFPVDIADSILERFKNDGLIIQGLPHVLVALCPSAKHHTKRWLREYYVELGSMLIETFDARIMLLGGPEDRAYCEDIARLTDRGRVINYAGEFSLLQSAAAFDHASLVVSNDTGLMHLATARKRPLIALFGPTVRELGFFPYGEKSVVIEHTGLSCRPCSHIGTNTCPRSHFKCMKEVTPESVFEQVRKFLSVPR